MPAKAATGPKYGDLAKQAILALKDRTGSSLPAIKKYFAANFKTATNETALKQALKMGVHKGTFVRVKASYKVSAEAKKASAKKKAATKKAAANRINSDPQGPQPSAPAATLRVSVSAVEAGVQNGERHAGGRLR